MRTSGFVRIAIDNSVINWKAFQGREPTIQADDEKRRDYEAIERLFELQERCRVVLVAVDQVDREASKTSDESKRTKLLETLKLCKEKFYLTRFERSTVSKKAAKARGKSGINLGEGAYWVTEDNVRRIKEYIASGRNVEEKVDLEVLATVAIAGVRLFVTVDGDLLANSQIREFVKRKDGIWIYRPSEILLLLDASCSGESERE
ncbi:hypothetical protein ES703_03226 [subsurface metagenome]